MNIVDVTLVGLVVLGAAVTLVRRFFGNAPEKPSKAVVGSKLADALRRAKRGKGGR